MIRLTLTSLFVLMLAIAGCREEPDLEIDTPDGGVEVYVDDE